MSASAPLPGVCPSLKVTRTGSVVVELVLVAVLLLVGRTLLVVVDVLTMVVDVVLLLVLVLGC